MSFKHCKISFWNILIDPRWKWKIFDFFKISHFLTCQNFSGTSLARHLFFSWSSRLQKSKLQHQLRWENTIWGNPNVQMYSKKRLKHAQVITTFFDKGRPNCSFRSIALSSWAELYNCSTSHLLVTHCFKNTNIMLVYASKIEIRPSMLHIFWSL